MFRCPIVPAPALARGTQKARTISCQKKALRTGRQGNSSVVGISPRGVYVRGTSWASISLRKVLHSSFDHRSEHSYLRDLCRAVFVDWVVVRP